MGKEVFESRYGPRYILSATLRRRYERGEQSTLLTNTVESLLDSASIPGDPFKAIDLLVEHIAKKSGRPGKAVNFDLHNDYPLIFAQDTVEFHYYLQKALELKYIEQGEPSGYRLGVDGWRRLAKLKDTRVRSDQAFVAMWFDDDLKEAWRDGFKAALEDCGYRPMRIDLQEHNEKICDRIIAEIRRSGLLIADFTGQRGGVYFEAGFAMGLDLPVIWTCREDDVSNLHFDTRQYNHIVWKAPDDLRTKLRNRLEATVPNS